LRLAESPINRSCQAEAVPSLAAADVLPAEHKAPSGQEQAATVTLATGPVG